MFLTLAAFVGTQRNFGVAAAVALSGIAIGTPALEAATRRNPS